MAKNEWEESVFHPGGARRLLEGGGEDLTDDERALLLALLGVDAEAGRSLDEEERAALDKVNPTHDFSPWGCSSALAAWGKIARAWPPAGWGPTTPCRSRISMIRAARV